MEPKEIRRLNLLRLMADRGWNEHRLAEHYGCSREYAIQLMNGSRGIGPKPIEKLIKIFGVDKEEFLIMPSDPGFWLNIHRLYKAESKDDLKDIVELFAQVEAGKLDRDIIKSLVMQAKIHLKNHRT